MCVVCGTPGGVTNLLLQSAPLIVPGTIAAGLVVKNKLKSGYKMPKIQHITFHETLEKHGLKSTFIPYVYEKNRTLDEIFADDKYPILNFQNPSGGGEDTMTRHLFSEKLVHRLVTSTTRAKRGPEHARPDADDSYNFIEVPGRTDPDQPLTDTQIDWVLNQSGRDFVEHDIHYGNLYGLERKSVEEGVVEAKRLGKIPIMMGDINALRVHRQVLGDEFNVIGTLLLPDSTTQSAERLGDSTELKQRHIDIIRYFDEYIEEVDLVIHNTAEVVDGKPGIDLFRAAGEEFAKRLLKSIK